MSSSFPQMPTSATKMYFPKHRVIDSSHVITNMIWTPKVYWGFADRADWLPGFPTYKTVKVSKNSNGQPHWRELRLLRGESKYTELWYRIAKEYSKQSGETPAYFDTYKFMMKSLLAWLIPRTPGSREVYDMVYDDYGIHFDDDSAKIQFMLQWAE